LGPYIKYSLKKMKQQPREIHLDELPYDPADRKRISAYTRNPKKQDEIRRRYLARGPYRPPPNLIIHIGSLVKTNKDLIRYGSRNMVVGSSTSTRWIKTFVCAANILEIAIRDKHITYGTYK
jgi:hypothetical protein